MGTDRDEDTRREADGTTDPAGGGLGSPAAAPPVGQRPPYRSARTLAKVVTAVFVLDLACLAVTALLHWDSLDIAQALLAGQEVTQESVDGLDARANEIAIMTLALMAVCGVGFCLWTYRVATNAPALGGWPSTSPGWAVGYYFIPIVSLWMPYQALVEVWDASDPDPKADAGAPKPHGFLLGWWLVWVIASLVDLVAYSWEPTTAESWIVQIHLSLVATAVEACAAALAIAVVWKLTRRQDDRAAALMPTARIA